MIVQGYDLITDLRVLDCQEVTFGLFRRRDLRATIVRSFAAR
jgi:hypothetical protein